VQVSELLPMWKCQIVVMDFLAATDIRKFPPKTGRGERAGGRWEEESGQVGNGWRCKGRRALLDFILFPLYYIDRFQILPSLFFSFVRRGRRVVGVELRHLAGKPGGGGD